MYLLWQSWALFNEFAVNRSSGGPPIASESWKVLGYHAEITVWYAFPGFQLGVLLTLVTYSVLWGGRRQALRSGAIAIIGEVCINLLIVTFLFWSGALW